VRVSKECGARTRKVAEGKAGNGENAGRERRRRTRATGAVDALEAGWDVAGSAGHFKQQRCWVRKESEDDEGKGWGHGVKAEGRPGDYREPPRPRACVCQQRVGGSHGTAADSQQRRPDVPLAGEGVLERSLLCVSPSV
jgi:hypothetical protein